MLLLTWWLSFGLSPKSLTNPKSEHEIVLRYSERITMHHAAPSKGQDYHIVSVLLEKCQWI